MLEATGRRLLHLRHLEKIGGMCDIVLNTEDFGNF